MTKASYSSRFALSLSLSLSFSLVSLFSNQLKRVKSFRYLLKVDGRKENDDFFFFSLLKSLSSSLNSVYQRP